MQGWEIAVLALYLVGIMVMILTMNIAIKELLQEDPRTELAVHMPFFWLYMTLIILVWPVSIVTSLIIYKKDKA